MLFVLFWRDFRRILQTDFLSFFFFFKGTQHEKHTRPQLTCAWKRDRLLTEWRGSNTLTRNCLCSAFSGRAKPLIMLRRGWGGKKKNTSIKHEHIQEIDCESARARGGSMSGGETRCCLAGGITESFSRGKKPHDASLLSN